MSGALAWIESHPLIFVWLVATLFAVLGRFAAPGSRWGAVANSIGSDVIKLACVILKVPLPGGFSPAQAVIPSTEAAIAKMPAPEPKS